MLSVKETIRISKFLETHFCENMGFEFTFKGQRVPGVSVFHSSFMLGIACYAADAMKLEPDGKPFLEAVEASEVGFFRASFKLSEINGFRLIQIMQILEMFFGISSVSFTKKEKREFDLKELVDSLMKNYMPAAATA